MHIEILSILYIQCCLLYVYIQFTYGCASAICIDLYSFHPRHILKSSNLWFLCIYRKAGIKCVIIRGVSKSVGYEVGSTETLRDLRTKWNAVWVKDSWRLVHPLWASQTVVGSYLHTVPYPCVCVGRMLKITKEL